jgi:coproporphyrinogen III oxidase-like Fe-S oxidoreductase
VVRGLERLGYCWYEVSNFAAPGRRCRHNSAVWRGEDYLGLGAGAVSTLGAQRRRNAPDVEAYLAALAPAAFAGNGRRPAASRGNGRGGAALAPSAPPRQSGESSGKASAGSSVAPACEAPPGSPVAPPRDVERLAAAERARERLYLAARTGAATPLRDLQGVLDSQAVQPLEEAGFVRVAGGTLRVTRKGRYVADEVCVRLFRASCVRGTEEVPQGAAYGTAPQETA